MLPLLVPSGVLAFVAAVVLLGTANLEGSEPMSEQGLVGWLAVLLGLVIWPLPAYFGVWFGTRGIRRGQGYAAIIATALNAAAIAGIWLLSIVTTVNQL